MPSEKALSIISLLITIVIACISYYQTLTPATLQEKYHQEEKENDDTIIQHNEEMLKIHQASLQQCMNHEHTDVQAGFRKGRGTSD